MDILAKGPAELKPVHGLVTALMAEMEAGQRAVFVEGARRELRDLEARPGERGGAVGAGGGGRAGGAGARAGGAVGRDYRWGRDRGSTGGEGQERGGQ